VNGFDSKVGNEPGFRSVPHHHGEAETGGMVLSGKARIYFDEDYADHVDMGEGDVVFVPPYRPHVEVNMATSPLPDPQRATEDRP
jgi:uncharacterized RmlC-like cupin family protein